MTESEFRRLIERYQHGELSEEEKALVDEWFEHLGKDKAPGSWTQQDKTRLKQSILTQIKPDEDVFPRGEYQQSAFFSTWPWRKGLQVAASLLVIAALSYAPWCFEAIDQRPCAGAQHESPEPEVNKVILSDGSIVWVKRNSSLSYPEKFGEGQRHVTLQGEALFEVAEDLERPFIVECNGLTTKVLGTSFNIRADNNDIEVVVLDGKVSLTTERDTKGVIVLPNERAVYNSVQKHIEKITAGIPASARADALKGTDYNMYFEDTEMEHVIRRIEDKFDVKIYTRNAEIANCVITADFTGQSLEQTLDLIGQALRFQYEIDGRTVILRGAGCNE